MAEKLRPGASGVPSASSTSSSSPASDSVADSCVAWPPMCFSFGRPALPVSVLRSGPPVDPPPPPPEGVTARSSTTHARPPAQVHHALQSAADEAEDGDSEAVRLREMFPYGTECCISFREPDQLVQLPCKHCFEKDCLEDWLRVNSLCPVCRADVGPDYTLTESAEWHRHKARQARRQERATRLVTAVLPHVLMHVLFRRGTCDQRTRDELRALVAAAAQPDGLSGLSRQTEIQLLLRCVDRGDGTVDDAVEEEVLSMRRGCAKCSAHRTGGGGRGGGMRRGV